MVPGFTLFRRTSSRVSNPTAQGVTLRGLGGTGASRSLVLTDGVPLNDAFGGWVYRDKVPQVAIDRVEVLRGSGSDLYGADAVGGVVQILTWHPSQLAARALVEGGGMQTGRISMFGGGRSRGWSYTAGGEWFTTDGYIAVAVEQEPGIAPRGPIDSEIASKHRSGVASIGYQAGNGWRVDTTGSVFTDNRLNGTPAVINDTASRQGTSEGAGGLAGGLLSARAFAGTQGYDQTFSAVSRRSDERGSQSTAACADEVQRGRGAVGPANRTAHRARRSRSQVHQRRDARDAACSRARAGVLQQRRYTGCVVRVRAGHVSRQRSADGGHGRPRRPVAHAIAEHQLRQDAGIVQSAGVVRLPSG